MKPFLKKILGILFILSTAPAFALDIIPSDSSYYYQMNGGSNFSLPPVTDQNSVTLGGSLSGQAFSCNGFNPAVSIENGFNNIASNLQSLSQSVVNNATSMMEGFGLAKLAAIDPSAYSFLENAFKSIYDTFNVSEQTCQQTLNSLENGQSPSQSWFSVSDSQGWLNYSQQSAQGQQVDINQASQNIATNPAAAGVPWIHQGQNAGGANQTPIKVIYDVVTAGYNSQVDASRPLDDTSPAPTTSPLSRYWPTPDAAGQWASLVLGNITITSDTSDDAKKQNIDQGGTGLVTLLYSCPPQANNTLTCPKTIEQNIAAIVESQSPPQPSALAAISSYGMNVTPDVITTIRNMPSEEQAITISKMANDVAFQNLVDEALLLRQLLISGQETQPVQNSQAAINTTNQVMTNLQNDIDNLKYEYDIRQDITSDTLQKVLSVQSSQQAGALAKQPANQSPEMQNGSIYTEPQS